MGPENPTFPTPPPQVTHPTVSPVFPKKNNVVVIVLSFFLLVTLLISGYLFFQVQSLTKQLAQLQIQSTPTPPSTEIPSPTPDPTSSWKTYTDNTYPFQFRYPSSWITEVKRGQNEDIITTSKNSWTIVTQLNHPVPGKTGEFGMGASSLTNYKIIPMLGRNALREKVEDGVIPFNGADNPSPEPYRIWIYFQRKPGEEKGTNFPDLDSSKGYLLLFGVNDPLDVFNVGITVKNSKLTKLNIVNKNIDSKELEEIDQILSTFKFTD